MAEELLEEELVNKEETAAREVLMYRRINGQKVRWKFVVDEEFVIINEGPANTTPATAGNPLMNMGQGRPDGKDPLEVYKETLSSRGYDFSTTEDGRILIKDTPPIEQDFNKFFGSTTPGECPDRPGWKEMHIQYLQEIKEKGGQKCPGCTRNAIMRKYRALLEKITN